MRELQRERREGKRIQDEARETELQRDRKKSKRTQKCENDQVRMKQGHHICRCAKEPLITAPHGHSAWPLKCFEVHHPMKRA